MRDIVLIVRMTGDEAKENAVSLSSTVEAAGYSPVIIPYWKDEGESKLLTSSCELPPLVPTEIGDAPRLSAFEFERLHRYAFDFPAQMCHSYAIGEIRSDTLLPESPWAQHLRGIAHCFHLRLAEIQPDYVFIPNGAELISAMLAQASIMAGTKILYWESPFFRGYHFLDPYAPHFFPEVNFTDRNWTSGQILPQSLSNAREFIREFQRGYDSKYIQTSDIGQLADFKLWSGHGLSKTVFVPYQVPTDANVAVNLGHFANFEDSVQAAIQSVPLDWKIIVKQHPKGGLRRPISAGRHDIFIADKLSIRDVLASTTAVATMSSNVGLEAAILGLPVVVWGRPVYSGKEFTLDLSDPRELGSILSLGLESPPRYHVEFFLGQLLQSALVRKLDGEALRATLAHASSTYRRFDNYYGSPVKGIAKAVGNLAHQLETASSIVVAFDNLVEEDRATITALGGNSLLNQHSGALEAYLKFHHFYMDPDIFSRIFFFEKFIFSRSDLKKEIDPIAIVNNYSNEISKGINIIFDLAIDVNRDFVIHNFSVSDLKFILALKNIDAVISIIYRNDRQFLSDSNGATHAVAILRGRKQPIRLSAKKRESIRIKYQSTTLPPYLFSGEGQRRFESDDILISGPATERHVVYGPYRRLPSGTWTARILLAAIKQKSGICRWTFDVVENGRTLATSNWEADGSSPPPDLTFIISGDGPTEIRIWSHNLTSDDVFSFRGVTLVDEEFSTN